jgi:hypothetical protein
MAKKNKCPKTPPDLDHLPFDKKDKMIDWFDPRELARTGLQSLLSGVFGAYADKREVQAALVGVSSREPSGEAPQQEMRYDADHSTKSEIWIDFVADLGDGFDSTYTVARLLALPRLRFRSDRQPAQANEPAAHELQRAALLILGGDQVYPAAKREEYRDRFEQPYRAALPAELDENGIPDLYAIPGNHDWYDGLTSFMRLFCQDRWIGGWRTRQKRSYFALRLPHKWWLWGIDIQLNADIDQPQMDYFKRIARDPEFDGSKVILCTGQPSWTEQVKSREESDDRLEYLRTTTAYQNLGMFERMVISESGAGAVLTLTGDLHHYCRYESEDGSLHKITAGGGGAYLYGTHGMPDKIYLDDSASDDNPPITHKRAGAAFPDFKTSKRIALKALAFPFYAKWFALMLGCVYLVNSWILQSASKKWGVTFLGEALSRELSLAGLWQVLKDFGEVLAHSPSACLFFALLVVGLWAFADGTGFGKFARGVIHGLTHVFANVVLMWLAVLLNFRILKGPLARSLPDFSTTAENIVDDFRQTLLFSVEMVVAGSLVAGVLFGAYLAIHARWFKLHINEAFLCQAIPDYKNFLRLHIDPSGALRVYPIGIESVCKKWILNPKAANGEPWFDPPAGVDLSQLPRLIEEPIIFDETRRGSSGSSKPNRQT